LTYVLGIPTITGKKAEMGTIFHKVMECLANCKLAIQEGRENVQDDVVGEISIDGLENTVFVKEIFQKSYTHYSSKSVHKYSPKDKNDIWSWVESVLDGPFDPRCRNIIAAEPSFDIEINKEWAKYDYIMPDGTKLTGNLRIKGTIDLVTRLDNDTIEVIDWKTGECRDWGKNKPKIWKDFCIDPQLNMYYYALKNRYPDVKNWLSTINYVRTAGPFTVAHDEEDILKVEKMLRRQFEKIKHNTFPSLKTSEKWFCKCVCHYGKNMSEKNPKKTICKYITDKLRCSSLDKIVTDETWQDFNIGYYQNPGE
jgi:hypothetical protein